MGMASFLYEGLHRYCFTCKRISHEENTCPELNEEQHEIKKRERAALMPVHDKTQGVTFSSYRHAAHEERMLTSPPQLDRRSYGKQDRNRNFEKNFGQCDISQRAPRMDVNHSDLRVELEGRRDSRGKEVLNRLDRRAYEPLPLHERTTSPVCSSRDGK